MSSSGDLVTNSDERDLEVHSAYEDALDESDTELKLLCLAAAKRLTKQRCQKNFRQIFFYELKLGRVAAETARNVDEVWDQGSVDEPTVRTWFWKFRCGDLSEIKKAVVVPANLTTTN
uniref:HTH_48 domain-containing protein n=1 Tax=Angiostrongylus cantonensis TaxID=6313 RepID=A0A0K0CXN4_ANGCA